MNPKTNPSQKAETLPQQQPEISAVVAIPDTILMYAEHDEKAGKVVARIADTAAILEESKARLAACSAEIDLRAITPGSEVVVLQARLNLAPGCIEALEGIKAQIMEGLDAIKQDALKDCGLLLDEVTSSHVTLAALKVREHFETLDAARAVMKENATVKPWALLREEVTWSRPGAERVLQIARQACDELTRVRPALAAANRAIENQNPPNEN